MFATLLLLSSLTTPQAPIVRVGPPVFDTVSSEAVHFYGGFQTPNRDLRAGFELGAKYEFLVIHPYMMRLGADYSQARVTDPFAPAGIKQSLTLSADAVAYRGTNGVISYLGVGLAFGAHDFDISGKALDSLNRTEGVTSVSLSNKFGYRVFIGMRFHELFVFEMSFQQANPDYVKRKQTSPTEYSEIREDGTFSVARVTFGYLLKL